MMIFGAVLLSLIAVTGFVIVRTHDRTAQVFALTFYGLLFGLLFFVFQAPDVALSQITVGGLALPLMLMLAISRMRSRKERQEKEHER
jgi:energy-converting hydrogenase B subunit D